MADYEPLDLSEHRNGGLDALGPGATAELGPRHFRGLPFDIGADPAECFISLDGDCSPVTVPVGGHGLQDRLRSQARDLSDR